MISLRNIAYLIDNHYVSVAKQTNIDTLSMNKDRHIISEIRGFFAESDNTKAIQGVMNVMDHIQITQRQTGFAKSENCKFTAEQIFRLAVLFPFFPIKNVRNYTKSMLGQLFMLAGLEELYISESMGHSQGNDVTSGYQDMYPLEIRFRNNSKLLNLEKEEEPIDIDSLTPEQMKEMLKKMMGQQ